jgi:hypothetical protein
MEAWQFLIFCKKDTKALITMSRAGEWTRPFTHGNAVSTLDIPIRLLRVVPYKKVKGKTRNYDHRTLNLHQQLSRGLFMEHKRCRPFADTLL